MDAESKAAIKNYFSLMDFFSKSAQGSGKFRYSSGGVAQSGGITPLSERDLTLSGLRAESATILPQLREAKIFSIPASVYREVFNAVDMFIVEDAGCKLPSSVDHLTFEQIQGCFPDEPLDPTPVKVMDLLYDDKSDALVKSVIDPFSHYMNKTYPDIGRDYPTRMPFGLMYLGYGEGVELSQFQLHMRFKNQETLTLHGVDKSVENFHSQDFDSYKVVGVLLNSEGDAWEMSTYSVFEPLVFPKNIPDVGGRTMSLSATALTGSEQLEYLEAGMKDPKFRALLNNVLTQYNELLHKGGYRPLPGSYEDYTLYPTRSADHGDAWTFGRMVTGFAYYALHVGTKAAQEDGVRTKDPLGYWCNPWSLSPWVVPTLVDLINENNKTFVFNGTYDKETRKEIGKNHKRLVRRKKKKPVLPAYYVIDVKPKIVRARSKSSLAKSLGPKRSHVLTHRHDRDGHERVLVKRGDLPLLEDDRALLEARGYTLYTDSQPEDTDKDRLVRRRLPLREAGEWLAMRTSWVRDTVVGDESLPYRPAVRRLSTESIVDLIRGN